MWWEFHSIGNMNVSKSTIGKYSVWIHLSIHYLFSCHPFHKIIDFCLHGGLPTGCVGLIDNYFPSIGNGNYNHPMILESILLIKLSWKPVHYSRNSIQMWNKGYWYRMKVKLIIIEMNFTPWRKNQELIAFCFHLYDLWIDCPLAPFFLSTYDNSLMVRMIRLWNGSIPLWLSYNPSYTILLMSSC